MMLTFALASTWLFAVCAMGQASEDCSSKPFLADSYQRRSGICCQNTTYKFPLDIPEVHDCNVEPQNSSLSYEDSLWTVYICLVKQSLGSKLLSKASLFELWSQNMTATLRAQMLNKLSHEYDRSSKETGELHLIKSTWDAYFDAEYEVCNFMSLYKKGKSQKSIKKKSRGQLIASLEPSVACSNGKAPVELVVHNWNNKPQNASAKVEACIKRLESHKCFNHSTTTDTDQFPSTQFPFGLCQSIYSGFVTMEDLDGTVTNYTSILNKMLPKYYSKVAREETQLLILNDLKEMSSSIQVIATLDFQQVMSLIEAEAKAQLKTFTVKTGTEIKDTEFLVAAMCIHKLFEALDLTEFMRCTWI